MKGNLDGALKYFGNGDYPEALAFSRPFRDLFVKQTYRELVTESQ